MSNEYVSRTEEVLSDDGFFKRVHEHVTVRLRMCPFCGAPGKTREAETDEGVKLRIVCPACEVGTTECEDYEDAAMAWNKRVHKPLSGKKGAGDCPFCGGKAEMLWGNDDETEDLQRVECRDCEARTEYYSDGKEALKRWNRRV